MRKISRSLLWLGLLLILVVVVPLFGAGLLNPVLGMDISGWMQACIALISFPVILFELDQIRQAVSRKPELEVGLANMRDLPFSQVRMKRELPKEVKVSAGYAHFYIVLRNRGKAPARYVKVYVEHINREQNVFPPPFVKVTEFSENKPSFVHEHNFDFVFRAGTDWIINPNDIEPFGFHITTSVIVEETNSAGVEMKHAQYPPSCEVILDCTVWAEGLEQPKKERFSVQVVEHLEQN